jgi:hypothetical protein
MEKGKNEPILVFVTGCFDAAVLRLFFQQFTDSHLCPVEGRSC